MYKYNEVRINNYQISNMVFRNGHLTGGAQGRSVNGTPMSVEDSRGCPYSGEVKKTDSLYAVQYFQTVNVENDETDVTMSSNKELTWDEVSLTRPVSAENHITVWAHNVVADLHRMWRHWREASRMYQ